MITLLNQDEKITINEKETIELVMEISSLNTSINSLLNELKESRGKTESEISIKNIRSLRTSVNKLKLELDKLV